MSAEQALVDVQALDARIAIHGPAPAGDAVRAAWVDALAPADAGPPDAGVAVACDVDGRPDLADLSTRVTLAAIEHGRRRLTMLHACAVAGSDGAVAAFVGPSGAGKTTMARALAAYAGYVTDETVAVTSEGTVLPYRKPLSLVRPDGPKEQVAPGSLGLLTLPPVPLRLVSLTVLERHDAAPPVPECTPVPLVDALAGLVGETSHLPDHPDGLGALVRLATSVGGVRRVRYRDATDVVPLLPDLLVPSAAVPTVAVGHAPVADARSAPGYRRAPGAQWVDDRDRIAVLNGRSFVVLQGAGAATWRLLDAPHTTAQLTTALVAELGRPDGDDPRDAVSGVVSELVRAGVVAESASRHPAQNPTPVNG